MLVSELKSVLSKALKAFTDQHRDTRHGDAEYLPLNSLLGEGLSLQALKHRTFLHLLKETYGNNAELLRMKVERLTTLCDLFLRLYGDIEAKVLRAPARINILGEHVDYVSYLPTASLPFASREHDMIMLYGSSDTGRVRGASTLTTYAPFSFMLDEGPLDADGEDIEHKWVSYLYARPLPPPNWRNYLKGAVFYARLKFPERVRSGFDFVVDSDIPPGGGASSSSALTVLASAAIRAANQITYGASELAHEASQAEWFAGTRGGAMDHMTICLAERRKAVHISYAEKRAELIPLPDEEFRWVTFFSKEADKGGEVMLEYNERAAISRIIIPAIIDNWRLSRPKRYQAWKKALENYKAGSLIALDVLEQTLAELPETLTIGDLKRNYPDAFQECIRAFPALFTARDWRPLKVRDRARHHTGEVRRVAFATNVLRDISTYAPQEQAALTRAGMRTIGELLDESHASLCALYDVCIPEVDQLLEIIASDEEVYGARLMGGGFGGNVLALSTNGHVSALVERVQSEYYTPRGRDALQEGSVMVSTPGAGLTMLNVEAVWRETIILFNTKWWESGHSRRAINSMIDIMETGEAAAEVWPIIVAAGRGTRAAATGLSVAKPLAPISGIAAIMRVLRTVREATSSVHPPILIVSPETEVQVREVMAGENVIIVVQHGALGTGDAVLCAHNEMLGFRGRALVIWGTQPVIRSETIRRSLKLADTFADYLMVLPTAVMLHPYAPLRRDHKGRVCGAVETHIEGARAPRIGESNIGVFIVDSEAMFETLLDVKRTRHHEVEARGNLSGGEFGFPNEVITRLSRLQFGVLASPIANWREEQGIKTMADIERCEQFIGQLENE